MSCLEWIVLNLNILISALLVQIASTFEEKIKDTGIVFLVL